MAAAKRAALRAEHRFRQNMMALNLRRTAETRPTTPAYVGLHVGEVFYGNIGSEDRLDFTVVGPAVNEVSRIASMCRSVDRELLASSAFRTGLDATGRGYLVSTGRYALRGIGRAPGISTPSIPTLPSMKSRPDATSAIWRVSLARSGRRLCSRPQSVQSHRDQRRHHRRAPRRARTSLHAKSWQPARLPISATHHLPEAEQRRCRACLLAERRQRLRGAERIDDAHAQQKHRHRDEKRQEGRVEERTPARWRCCRWPLPARRRGSSGRARSAAPAW